ncbi:hypothetical protein RB594_004668 [Gaeumannomyces avenae]
MARKGSKKVKTGCRTCKIRKVKCDEQRPACVRCTSTGRSCDGYEGPRGRSPAAADGAVAVSHRPHAKLAPRTAVWLVTGPRLSEPESRSFQHYQEVTAPEYSRVCDDFFWRGAVMVLGQTQPAVQHALIAVSSVHEQFHLAAAGPSIAFATRQYNTAIRHMISKSAVDDERETGAILVVSILFATLEFLLGNHVIAIEHCRHAVLIFNGMRFVSPWMRKNLLPFVRRATTYPLFLAGHVNYEPLPALVDDFGGALSRTTFQTLDEAREVLHGLASQATRLLHLANPFRIGSRRAEPIPESLRAEHHAALAALDRWSEMFAIFRALPRGASPPRQQREDWCVDPLTELQMRALTARAWLAAHYNLDAGELAFDDHMDDFRRINDLARSMVQRKNCSSDGDQQNHQSTRFRFDVGVMPPLYFTVRWCRDLAVRLDALRLLCQLCHGDECIFDIYTLASALRAVIDREHAIDLASLPWRGGDGVHEYLPAYREDISAMNPQAWAAPAASAPAKRRVWDATVMPETAQVAEPVFDGKATGKCRVRYVEIVNDRVCHTDEIVTVATNLTANVVASGIHAQRMAALRKSVQNADPLVHGPAIWLSWGGC